MSESDTDTKEVTLSSGVVLKITLAPLDDAKALLDAMLEEATGVEIRGSSEFGDLCKNMLAKGISSKKVDAAFKKCLTRCAYNGQKIDADTFQGRKAREDYLDVMYEVVMENISPFTKSLYARFSDMLVRMGTILA